TLTVDGALNGCIGTIEAAEPLGQAVARLARAAAFSDPRLPALTHEEYSLLDIEISILSPLSPIPAASRAELLAGLRPGIDGLVIEEGGARALFLPTVWEQLPEPDDFLDHLHHKAGIAAEPWPPDLRAFRFITQIFSRHAGTPPTGGPG
ncbi:MAG: AmmeMemoRadiSam system protein A, partial [Acidimicrobiales bacterium]